MKKRILMLLTVLLAITALSACGKAPEVNSDFTAAFSAVNEDDGAAYTGSLVKNGDDLHISLDTPYTVKGTVFDYTDGGLHIVSGSHSTNADSFYLPLNSLPATLYNALAYLDQAEYSSTESGEDRYTLPTPEGSAELYAKDGAPVSLVDTKSGWQITFESH